MKPSRQTHGPHQTNAGTGFQGPNSRWIHSTHLKASFFTLHYCRKTFRRNVQDTLNLEKPSFRDINFQKKLCYVGHLVSFHPLPRCVSQFLQGQRKIQLGQRWTPSQPENGAFTIPAGFGSNAHQRRYRYHQWYRRSYHHDRSVIGHTRLV